MRRLLLVCLISFLTIGLVNAAPEDKAAKELPTATEVSTPEDKDLEDIDELLESSPDTQPNGSDISPDKVYSQEEYQQIYRDLEVPTFRFHHDVDPDQYYDMKDAAWSPYPLLRLNSPIYFKSITILPGYYLLTPRQYKGDWYLLFKEAGKVKYIIPVFEKNFTQAGYYETHLKEADMRKSQRWMVRFLDGVGRTFKSSKRKPPIKTNLELTDLDNKFLLIEIYYGATRYKTIFRTEKF